MRDFDLRALQLAELEMLKDFHVFCEENDIVYFLGEGTLLGAVRHQGFIPWDDDIDILMDVKNYKKFLRIAPKKLSKRYFCQNYRTDYKVGVRWSRVRINGTTSMERNMTNYDIHYGVCMDIFVMTGLRRSKIGQKLQITASQLWTILLEKHYSQMAGYNVSPWLEILYRYIPEKMRILLCRVLENIVLLDSGKADILYNTWFCNPITEKAPFIPKEFLLPSEQIKLRFEDAEFYVPRQYENCLEILYGDWKTIPPENERVTHGDIIVDLNNDYSKYFTGKK